MVTPSFVIVGAPNFLSRTTFRPRGPSVTRTVLASLSTPRWSASRAAELNCSCFAMDLCSSLLGPRFPLAPDRRSSAGTIPERVLIGLNLPHAARGRNSEDSKPVEREIEVHLLDRLGVRRDHGGQPSGRDHRGPDVLLRGDAPHDRVHLADGAEVDARLEALLGAPAHHALRRTELEGGEP